MNAGSKLAFLATFIAAAGCTALMTVATQFQVLLRASAAVIGSETMVVLAVLGQVVLAVVTVMISSIVAQVAFRQAVDELRRDIALRRLVGSKRKRERARLFGSFVLTGTAGGAGGWLFGAAIGALAGFVLRASREDWSGVALPWVDPIAVIPAVAIVLGAAVAAWGASRRVFSIAPAEAVRAASHDEDLGGVQRHRGAVALLIVGAAVLFASYGAGFLTPLAILPGVLGGAVSVLGIVGLATPLTTGMLRMLNPLGRKSLAVTVALDSLMRSPKRTGGIVIALMVGVATVTMFAVAGQSGVIAIGRASMNSDLSGEQQSYLGEIVTQFMMVISLAVACGALIAVFGFAATMQMSIAARTREIGLLRLVGLTVRRAKQTVLVEAAIIGMVALVGGFLLGVFYGWFGASIMFASYPEMGLLLPAIPWALPLGLVVATAAVAWGAGAPAARRASRIRALEAIAVT